MTLISHSSTCKWVSQRAIFVVLYMHHKMFQMKRKKKYLEFSIEKCCSVQHPITVHFAKCILMATIQFSKHYNSVSLSLSSVQIIQWTLLQLSSVAVLFDGKYYMLHQPLIDCSNIEMKSNVCAFLFFY